MPINISQESYERVKRSPSPVVMPPKAKKPRTESPEPQKMDISMDITQVDFGSTFRIMFSLCAPEDKKELEMIVTQLGGSVATSVKQATHLVMKHLARTTKLMNAITLGLTIVPDKWLHECKSEKKFISEAPFKFDTKEFDLTYKCDFYKTLENKNRDKLFTNKVFFITPSVFPSAKEIKEMIELAGGMVEIKRRSLQQIEAVNMNVPCSYFILTTANDLHLVYDCLRNSNQKFVSSCEVVFNSIMKQELNIDEFLVKVEQTNLNSGF